MRHARRLLALLVLVPYAYSTTQAAPIKDSSLICHPGKDCYPSVFTATEDFQTVHSDQELPPGLHYRINIYTGEKEAKLLAPGEEGGVVVGSHGQGAGTEEVLGGEVAVQPHDIIEVPGTEKEEVPEMDMAEAERQATIRSSLVHSPEQQAFTDLLLSLNTHATQPEEKLLETLSSLEDLAHSLDWGLEIASSSALPDLLHLLSSSPSPSIRSSAAIVLGSALSNNPKAVAAVATSKPNVVQLLLSRSKKEESEKVRGRLIYALDKAVKSEAGLKEFKKQKGVAVLTNISEKAQAADIVGRIAVFVDDNFLNGDMQAEEEVEEDKKAAKKKEKKTVITGLGEFCGGFREMLKKEEGQSSAKEKIMKTYLALREKGEKKCHETVRDEEAEWVKTDL